MKMKTTINDEKSATMIFPQSTKVFPQSIVRSETRFLPISRAPTARDAHARHENKAMCRVTTPANEFFPRHQMNPFSDATI